MEPEQPPQQSMETIQYEQIHSAVAAEFNIEEGFIEYNTPTFYISSKPDLKQAFMRLYKQLDSKQLVPILRRRENRLLLQVVPKPAIRPNRPTINIVLLLATIGTTLITGYVLSETLPNPLEGAIFFSGALMSILVAHEMGHKLTANMHNVEATYPYFIPGIPPFFPTFGAVIQQKSLPPNKDALFDLGMSGPVLGFLITIVVTIIGISMSTISTPSELPQGVFPPPLLLEFLVNALLTIPPVSAPSFVVIELHPLAFAGYIGMVVTMLNLIPVGQLDGGHVAHVLLGERSRNVLSVVSIIALFFISWPMAFIAFLVSRVRHPPPLDDVSQLSGSRKLATLVLVAIFILCLAPILPII